MFIVEVVHPSQRYEPMSKRERERFRSDGIITHFKKTTNKLEVQLMNRLLEDGIDIKGDDELWENLCVWVTGRSTDDFAITPNKRKK